MDLSHSSSGKGRKSSLMSHLQLNLHRQFFKAVKAGYATAANTLLILGAKVNIQTKTQRMTPLMFAAIQGDVVMVNLLITRGANPKTKNAAGKTALMFAAESGHTEIIKIFTQIDCTGVNYLDNNNMTALMYAAQYGHVEAVAALLDVLAVPNIIANDGQTALRLAAQKGCIAVVKQLLNPVYLGRRELSSRWPSMIITKNDTWALIDAAEKGHTDVVNYLLDHNFDVNAMNERGATALMVAAQYNDMATLERLIKAPGLIIDLKNKVGVTALMLAVDNGHAHAVNILLFSAVPADANIETKKYGITPLMLAAELGYTDIAHALLNAGAKVNVVNYHQSTALMLAASHGHVNIVEALIKKGAKIDAQDKNGFTALMHAAKKGRTESVKILLECKAKLGFQSAQGQTAEMLAIQFKHAETVDVFKKHTKRPALNNIMPSAGFLPASSHMKKRARRKCLNAKNNLSQGMQDLTLTPNGQDVKTVQEQKTANKCS